MRDIKNVTESVTRTITNPFGGGATNTYTNTLFRSARADSVSTSRNATGGYDIPTVYSGYFYRGSGQPFFFNYYTGLGGETNKFSCGGKSAFNLLSTITQGTHGVTPSTFLPGINNWWSSTTASKVQGLIRQNQWDLAQDLAEFKQTLEFLVTPVKLVLDLLKSIRSNPLNLYNLMRTRIYKYEKVIQQVGERTSTSYVRVQRGVLSHYLRTNKLSILRQSAKGGANMWLAYKFAWLPLLQSIYSALQYVKDGLANHTFSASAHTTADLEKPAIRNLTQVVDSKWKGESGCKIECMYKLTSGFLDNLSRLGLTNPASVVWESLPLSFVVDWFLPVGSFLNAVSGNGGLLFWRGYQTNYVKYSWDATYYPVAPGEFGHTGRFMSYQCGMFSFVRNLLIGFPIPTPQFRGFGTKLSGDKILSLATLAGQRLL